MQCTFQFLVDNWQIRKRLDQFLYEQIGTVSRMFLSNLLAQDLVYVDGVPQPGGYRLQLGEQIELEFDPAVETAMTPEDLPLDILHEDAEILIVNKLAGMLVHPTKQIKTGTLANALAYHLNFDRQSAIRNQQLMRPGIVHRLDKQTSGLMVIAKTNRAHRILSDHFQRKLIKKTYLALVEGILSKDSGIISAPIGRCEEKPHWRVLENGKEATTQYVVLEKRETSTLLELVPVTGRTNQLRIHCAAIGHPIVGDEWYGGREYSRLCLHAIKLAIYHPNGGWLEFKTDFPKEFYGSIG
jgi:23S rRNA pseudouridine1911/1915/1917 synthase